jgi:hypothetical protein
MWRSLVKKTKKKPAFVLRKTQDYGMAKEAENNERSRIYIGERQQLGRDGGD